MRMWPDESSGSNRPDEAAPTADNAKLQLPAMSLSDNARRGSQPVFSSMDNTAGW